MKKIFQKYQSYIPSKKIQKILLIIPSIILVFGIFRGIQYLITPDTQKNIIVSLIDELDTQDPFLALDTDNDGAYDWEEALWQGLDPNNPDSDGDGVLDGQYIDIQNALAERARGGGIIVETDLSETEKLGRSLFTALLAAEQTTNGLDETTQDQISGNVADYISNLSYADNVYTRNMLFLVPDTKINSYAYRDEMKKVFTSYPVATSDIELIIRGTENPEEYKNKIRSTHLKYQGYLQKIVSLEVPYSIANQHTRLINVVGQIEAALFNLSQDDADDLVSLSSIVQTEKIMNQVTDTIIKINEYFEIVSTIKEFEKIVSDEDM